MEACCWTGLSGTSVWRPQSRYTVSRIECRIKFGGILNSPWMGNDSETPTPTTCLKSTAVHLQFVRQYAPHLYRRTFLASKLRRKGNPAVRLPFVLHYASHLYGSMPPICTAILLDKYWGLGSPERFWMKLQQPRNYDFGVFQSTRPSLRGNSCTHNSRRTTTIPSQQPWNDESEAQQSLPQEHEILRRFMAAVVSSTFRNSLKIPAESEIVVPKTRYTPLKSRCRTLSLDPPVASSRSQQAVGQGGVSRRAGGGYRGSCGFRKRIALQGGVAATVTPVALLCATKELVSANQDDNSRPWANGVLRKWGRTNLAGLYLLGPAGVRPAPSETHDFKGFRLDFNGF